MVYLLSFAARRAFSSVSITAVFCLVYMCIRDSYKGTHQIPGYFEYVVPPLEGLWWQEGQSRIDYAHKELSLIHI